MMTTTTVPPSALPGENYHDAGPTLINDQDNSTIIPVSSDGDDDCHRHQHQHQLSGTTTRPPAPAVGDNNMVTTSSLSLTQRRCLIQR